MKRAVVTATLLALILTAISSVPGGLLAQSGQVIVDRSTRSKVLNDYTLLTRDAIQKAWTIPLDLSVPHALKGKISINYVISSNGSLESLELVRGSGHPEMDRSLVQAIRSAAPFPPFPEEVAADRIVIRANFVVADLPTVPVTRVNYPGGDDTAAGSPGKTPNGNKIRWGVPAGAAMKKEGTVDQKTSPDTSPVPAPKQKMRWGHQP